MRHTLGMSAEFLKTDPRNVHGQDGARGKRVFLQPRYLDLYGDHGEGRVQQLSYVIERTDTAIQALEQKRAQIDETLAELRVINASCRGHLASRRRSAKQAT